MPMAANPGDAAGLADHLATGLQGRGPDFGGVMLDPARVREMLGQFDLAEGDRLEAAVLADLEGDGPARGRALVDGEDQFRHRRLPVVMPGALNWPLRIASALV